MQSQLSAALRQKERHAQLGQAVAKISHDLRNMLTTIQMLSDTLSLSKDPSVNRLTPKLVKNVERAVALTEGALTFESRRTSAAARIYRPQCACRLGHRERTEIYKWT